MIGKTKRLDILPAEQWYKAWFLFAPIWLGDPRSESPWVFPRPDGLGSPLLWLVEFLVCRVLIPLTSLVWPTWEPVFAFRITDKRWKVRVL